MVPAVVSVILALGVISITPVVVLIGVSAVVGPVMKLFAAGGVKVPAGAVKIFVVLDGITVVGAAIILCGVNALKVVGGCVMTLVVVDTVTVVATTVRLAVVSTQSKSSCRSCNHCCCSWCVDSHCMFCGQSCCT